MAILKAINLIVRFVLELCLLGALGLIGFRLGEPLIAKVALTILLPLLAAMIWGKFIAPRATTVVPPWLWLGIQLLLFGSAVVGLTLIGQAQAALILGGAVIINLTLLSIWGQHTTMRVNTPDRRR